MAHFHHRLLTDITEALHDNTIPGIRDPQAFVVSFFPKRKKAGEDLQVQHSTTICRGYRTSVRTFQHTTVLIGYEMGLLCTQLWPVRDKHMGWTLSWIYCTQVCKLTPASNQSAGEAGHILDVLQGWEAASSLAHHTLGPAL